MRARGLLVPRPNDEVTGKRMAPQNPREPRQLIVARSGAERARKHQSSSPEPLLGLPFADDDAGSILVGNARQGAASHGCDTSGVLAVNKERSLGPGVRTNSPDVTMLDAPRRGRPVSAPGGIGAAAIGGAEADRPYCVGGPAAGRGGQATGLHLSAALRDRGIDRRAKIASLYRLAPVWSHGNA